jgi:hypothetical protein
MGKITKLCNTFRAWHKYLATTAATTTTTATTTATTATTTAATAATTATWQPSLFSDRHAERGFISGRATAAHVLRLYGSGTF